MWKYHHMEIEYKGRSERATLRYLGRELSLKRHLKTGINSGRGTRHGIALIIHFNCSERDLGSKLDLAVYEKTWYFFGIWC